MTTDEKIACGTICTTPPTLGICSVICLVPSTNRGIRKEKRSIFVVILVDSFLVKPCKNTSNSSRSSLRSLSLSNCWKLTCCYIRNFLPTFVHRILTIFTQRFGIVATLVCTSISWLEPDATSVILNWLSWVEYLMTKPWWICWKSTSLSEVNTWNMLSTSFLDGGSFQGPGSLLFNSLSRGKELGVKCYCIKMPCALLWYCFRDAGNSNSESELWNAFPRKADILTCIQAKWRNRDLVTLFGLRRLLKRLSPKSYPQLSVLAPCTALLLQHLQLPVSSECQHALLLSKKFQDTKP